MRLRRAIFPLFFCEPAAHCFLLILFFARAARDFPDCFLRIFARLRLAVLSPSFWGGCFGAVEFVGVPTGSEETIRLATRVTGQYLRCGWRSRSGASTVWRELAQRWVKAHWLQAFVSRLGNPTALSWQRLLPAYPRAEVLSVCTYTQGTVPAD